MVDDVIAKYKGSVVLVSHRVVNKVLICALLGLDNSNFWNIRKIHAESPLLLMKTDGLYLPSIIIPPI